MSRSASTTLDLPDPAELPADTPELKKSADDLIAQMAEQQIDQMLADAKAEDDDVPPVPANELVDPPTSMLDDLKAKVSSELDEKAKPLPEVSLEATPAASSEVQARSTPDMSQKASPVRDASPPAGVIAEEAKSETDVPTPAVDSATPTGASTSMSIDSVARTADDASGSSDPTVSAAVESITIAATNAAGIDPTPTLSTTPTVPDAAPAVIDTATSIAPTETTAGSTEVPTASGEAATAPSLDAQAAPAGDPNVDAVLAAAAMAVAGATDAEPIEPPGQAPAILGLTNKVHTGEGSRESAPEPAAEPQPEAKPTSPLMDSALEVARELEIDRQTPLPTPSAPSTPAETSESVQWLRVLQSLPLLILQAINYPLRNASDQVREAIAAVGLLTLANALGVILYVLIFR
ncbi:MAG: hypothetical protein QM770_22795 [Tepidisphaeraceae bacterium]